MWGYTTYVHAKYTLSLYISFPRPFSGQRRKQPLPYICVECKSLRTTFLYVLTRNNFTDVLLSPSFFLPFILTFLPSLCPRLGPFFSFLISLRINYTVIIFISLSRYMFSFFYSNVFTQFSYFSLFKTWLTPYLLKHRVQPRAPIRSFLLDASERCDVIKHIHIYIQYMPKLQMISDLLACNGILIATKLMLQKCQNFVTICIIFRDKNTFLSKIKHIFN